MKLSKKKLLVFINLIFFFLIILFINSQSLKDRIKILKDDMIEKYHAFKFKNNQIKIGHKYYNLQKIDLPPEFNLFPVGYVEAKNDIVYLVSGTREFYYYDNKNQKISPIKNNLKKFHNIKSKDYWIESNIRDSLILDNAIYLTLNSCENIDNKFFCKMVLVTSNLSTQELIFKPIFETKKALTDIDFSHSGGRVSNYKKNKILIAIPDYGHPYEALEINSYYGKIIEFDILNFEKSIFSFGHRNPQGLYYDPSRDIVLESEHGPGNGDEINLVKKNGNYGWPNYSYGAAQGIETILDNNHAINGAVEPLKYFKSSIGPSQISKSLNDDEYVMASLRGFNGKKLFSFKITDTSYEIKDFSYFYVGDRIRDIVNYKNKLYMILENSKQLVIVN